MRSGVDQREGSASGRPFEYYLRTGVRLVPGVGASGISVKFNQNHDPTDGRFTFGEGGSRLQGGGGGRFQSGGGSFGGGGATGTFDTGPSPFSPRHPKNHTIDVVQKGDSLNKIAALRKGLRASDLAKLNGVTPARPLQIGQKLMLPTQRYLEAGRAAKNNFVALAYHMQSQGGKLPPNVAKAPSLQSQLSDPGWRRVSMNGYQFQVDPIKRTRSVDGVLTLNVNQRRSGTTQVNAGKPDRLPDDHGGHYIARIFNGPTDTVNHFAQNKGFNQSAYRKLENMLADTMRSGRKVSVHIVPHYEGASMRPSSITVHYSINGRTLVKSFPNTAEAKSYG